MRIPETRDAMNRYLDDSIAWDMERREMEYERTIWRLTSEIDELRDLLTQLDTEEEREGCREELARLEAELGDIRLG